MFSFFRCTRKPKPEKPGEIILDISHRYRQYWTDDAFSDLEEFCREEEGVALEMLLTELYEDEIEPTDEEKQTLIDLATEMGMSRDEILFWPEPPKCRKDYPVDVSR